MAKKKKLGDIIDEKWDKRFREGEHLLEWSQKVDERLEIVDNRTKDMRRQFKLITDSIIGQIPDKTEEEEKGEDISGYEYY